MSLEGERRIGVVTNTVWPWIRSRLWAPGWRLLTIAIVLLLVHSIWNLVEARRLERAARQAHDEYRARLSRGKAVEPARNAARYYEAAWALVIERNAAERQKRPDEPAAQERSREWLRSMEPSLALLDRGAELPECRYLWKEELPGLLRIRELAEACSLRTRGRAAGGDVSGAVASLASSFRHLRVFENAPLIGELVRVALLGIALEDTQRLLPRLRLEDLATVGKLVDDADSNDAMESAFFGERAWFIRVVPDAIQRPGSDVMPWYAGSWLARPLVRHLAMSHVDYITRLIDASRAPWPERVKLVSELRPPRSVRWLTAASLQRAARSSARVAALDHAMAVCVRIERYRLSHGILPQSLEALSTESGERPLPIDPFTGKAPLYRREGGGYLVYSVGEDGKDGGGTVGGAQQVTSDYGFHVERRETDVERETSPAARGGKT